MIVLLEIKDDKAPYLIEVLKNLSFVKTTTLTKAKARFFEELKEAVEDVKAIRKGRMKGRPAKKLINEL